MALEGARTGTRRVQPLLTAPQIAVTKRSQQLAKLERAATETAPSSLPRLAPPVRVRERRAQAKETLAEGRAAVLHTRQKAPLLAPSPPGQLSPEEAESFAVDLRRYRTLQSALQKWSDAFHGDNGRRPDKNDVASSRISWLMDHYREFSSLKRRLLLRTPSLRGSLAQHAREALDP